MPPRTTILWAGSVGLRLPVTAYVDAAASVGVAAISVSLGQFDGEPPTGPAVRAAAAYAADHGVAIAVADGLYSWLPPERNPLADRVRRFDEAVELAATLGATSLNALVPGEDGEVDELAGHFAAACDRAGEVGCAIHLEFSPLGGLPTLGRAADVVRAAGRPNGGICFDTWHFFRGEPDFETLSTMGDGEIMVTQLSDAPAEVSGSLWRDTLHHRRLPGEGTFDLERVVVALHGCGGLRRAGPEVLSDDLHALGPEAAARRACAAVDDLLARAIGTP